MGAAFIGLDLGTTGIKAVAFDGDDRELAAAMVATPTHMLDGGGAGGGGAGGGGAEYDADELWSAACDVLRQVGEQLAVAGHHVVALATASMGEAGVLIDGQGRPVAPVIAWFDQRTEPQAEWWREEVGVERTHRIAAVPPRAVFGAAKMLWTQANRADAWAAGRHWLNMADWAGFRLTGTMATDHSLASRTMLFDLHQRCWSSELIGAAGLDASRLAPLIESGQPLGRVTAEAAAQTGLAVGTPVAAGGQDHVCAALALGVTEPGMLLDSIGTAEAFFLVMDQVDTSGRVAAAGIGQGAHVERGRTYAMTGLQQGGGRIDAARTASGLGWAEFLATPEAERAMGDVATAGQARIAALLEATRTNEVRHLVTGGGSRNRRLLTLKREVGGRPIDVASQTEATALGAAHLARRAC